MLKKRIILIVISLVLVVAIFSLPRVVVDSSEENQLSTAQNSPSNKESNELHKGGFTQNEQATVDQLKKDLKDSENSQKSVIFADSLAGMYKNQGMFDSAAYYLSLAQADAEKIGLQYYEAFTYAVNADRAAELGKQTRTYLEQVLDADPSRMDIKSKIALTYISTENPMSGIAMLREILEEDPNNEDAIFNLGILSIQSKQYDRAVDRFKRLVEINDRNEQAKFYLAFSYYQLGQDEKAKVYFKQLMETSTDEELKATVEGYLKEIE